MSIRKYGLSDEKKVLQESQEAREIVAKIMDFGPSQKMLLYIINDLGMNLEIVEHMKKVTSACQEISDDMLDESGTSQITTSAKKLIV